MEFDPSKYLVKEWHEPCCGHHRLYRFENGFGASVISGPYSYGGDQGLFELAIIRWRGVEYYLTYDTDLTNDVIGYLNFTEVVDLLRKISELSLYGQLLPRGNNVKDLEN